MFTSKVRGKYPVFLSFYKKLLIKFFLSIDGCEIF